MAVIGILFAVTALVAWGFGDFFIQRATRKIGVLRALFFLEFPATIVLFPFIYKEIGPTLADGQGMLYLTAAALTLFVAALLIFKAYKDGKLAIVEPILALELLITVVLGIFVWNENLNFLQLVLVGAVFLGIILAITRREASLESKKNILEKGVWWAVAGAVAMGGANFLFGASSQETSPLMTMWYTSLIGAVFCFIYIVYKGEIRKLRSDLRDNKKTIWGQMILDNLAWTAYAFAMVYIPISIATTISESYVALSVMLGIFVNKEKIERHQIIGIVLAILGVILLGLVTG